VFKNLPPFLTNKYIVVLLGFILYIGFFDAHDLISQYDVKSRLWQIEEEIEYLDQNTADAKTQIKELTSDKEKLEKFAREQYRMKRENEDLFVLIEQE
jgi:cell division protein FtsB